jgi:tRNA dimethylallyltransferase
VVGPTGSGKSELALRLAEEWAGEIVNCDSLQLYRHLDIGTAKPTVKERGNIPHYFLDIIDPDQEYNAGIFGEQARSVVDRLFADRMVPVVVGGSGLYVRSLTDGLFDGPGADPEFRAIMERRLAQGEFPALLEELQRVDPASAARIDPSKPRRIVRALEVFHSTGTPLSALQERKKPQIDFTVLLCGLGLDRRQLYAGIERRVDGMIKRGLLEEVRRLQIMGYDRSLNALNTVGYAEAFAHLAGEISAEEMVRLIKRNTRRYAKRQMTWFSADRRVHWVPPEFAAVAALLEGHPRG